MSGIRPACAHRMRGKLMVAVLAILVSGCGPPTGGADSNGNHAVSPSSAPSAQTGSQIPKGIARFGGTDFAAMASAGFSFTTDGNDQGVLSSMGSNGLSGLVWLGAWNNAGCSWEYSNARVVDIVNSVKQNPRVLAYQVGDEPDPKACPHAPDAYAARTALVHQWDPTGLTLTILEQFNERSSLPISKAATPFKGAVDILAFDVYPCFQGQRSCDFAMINRAVSAIKSMNLPRWWAVIQDFQDGQWRWPTRSELDQQFKSWAGSGMGGYLVFAWDYKGSRITTEPGHVAQLSSNNSSIRA